jgi:hypothetical protein
VEEKMAQIDSKENSVVAVYPQHADAENAINLLKKADFNIKKLAIVGKGYHTEEQVVGYYTAGDRMKHWGKQGAFWGGLWGLLVGSAFFIIPGVDCGRSGECCCGRRFICAGGGTLQHWNPQGQCSEVRELDQSGQVFAHCAWDGGRS